MKRLPMNGLLCGAAVLAVAACDGKKTSKVDELMSAATAESTATAPHEPEKKKWDTMPELTVDDLGSYLGGERANVTEKGGIEKLRDIISRLPLKDKEVELVANKKALTVHVVTTVYELGKGGALAVTIKTDGRNGLPTEIRVVPESRLGSDPPSCSVAIMVTPERDTGVWTFKGGGGTKFRPGFAGPDLGEGTEEALEKGLKGCDSEIAFFSAGNKNVWEHAFNVGALLTKVDKDKKIKKLVLLEEPVAGRAITLKK
jgi:hypothetical protein